MNNQPLTSLTVAWMVTCCVAIAMVAYSAYVVWNQRSQLDRALGSLTDLKQTAAAAVKLQPVVDAMEAPDQQIRAQLRDAASNDSETAAQVVHSGTAPLPVSQLFESRYSVTFNEVTLQDGIRALRNIRAKLPKLPVTAFLLSTPKELPQNSPEFWNVTIGVKHLSENGDRLQ